jgi:hypothetical protein
MVMAKVSFGDKGMFGSFFGGSHTSFNKACATAKQKNGGSFLIHNIMSGQTNISALSDKDRGLLALSSARTSPVDTIECIAIFQLKGQKFMEEIAFVVADKSPYALAANINRLNIQKVSVHIELVKRLGKNAPDFLSLFVRNVLPQIKTVEEKFRLFKAVAEYSPSAVADNIGIGGINDEIKRWELAMLAAKKNGGQVSKDIRRFNISNDERRSEVFLSAYGNDPKGTHKYAIQYSLQANLLPGFLDKVTEISKKADLKLPSF